MKKIIGYLVIVLLFAGSICGITFGVMWSQNEKYIQDNSSAFEQVEELKDTIKLLTDNNEELQLKFDTLQDSYDENLELIESYKTQVSSLTEQLTSKENELTEKNEYIEGLESAKAELESQAVLDEAEIERLDTLLTQANQDKVALQSEIDEMSTTIGDLNVSIDELEEENSSLNSTIISLQEQIASLNSQIHDLQNSVTYYLELLEAYQNVDKFIVTFVLFDNGIETVYDVQTVDENDYLMTVETPIASDFEGWSLTIGGELIDDLTTVQVTEDMTIYGMCTNTVTFMVNGEEYATQEVSYNKHATDVEVSIAGYAFNGWSLIENGEIVSLNTTPIKSDVTFYALLEELPGFEKMTWNGYSRIYGPDVWTDGSNIYYSSGSNQYVLDVETSTWEEKTWNGLTSFLGECIWTDGTNIYYSSFSNQYVLDVETSTWEEKTWNGLTSFYGDDVWTDGTNIYHSRNNGQFVLNIETSTWEEKTWNGLTLPIANGEYIWTDGTNIYYSFTSAQYVLNIETSTWEKMTWNGFSPEGGHAVWTDGSNIYYSDGQVSVYGEQYVLV